MYISSSFECCMTVHDLRVFNLSNYVILNSSSYTHLQKKLGVHLKCEFYTSMHGMGACTFIFRTQLKLSILIFESPFLPLNSIQISWWGCMFFTYGIWKNEVGYIQANVKYPRSISIST